MEAARGRGAERRDSIVLRAARARLIDTKLHLWKPNEMFGIIDKPDTGSSNGILNTVELLATVLPQSIGLSCLSEIDALGWNVDCW
jgi:hypothetical protein